MEIEEKKERYDLVSTCEQLDLDDGTFEVIFNESLSRTSNENHPEGIRLDAFISNLKFEYEKVKSPEEREVRLKEIRRYKFFEKVFNVMLAFTGLVLGSFFSWSYIDYDDTDLMNKYMKNSSLTDVLKKKFEPTLIESLKQREEIDKKHILPIVQGVLEWSVKGSFLYSYSLAIKTWSLLLIINAVFSVALSLVEALLNYKYCRIRKKSILARFYKKFFTFFGQLFLYSSLGAILFSYLATSF